MIAAKREVLCPFLVELSPSLRLDKRVFLSHLGGDLSWFNEMAGDAINPLNIY